MYDRLTSTTNILLVILLTKILITIKNFTVFVDIQIFYDVQIFTFNDNDLLNVFGVFKNMLNKELKKKTKNITIQLVNKP